MNNFCGNCHFHDGNECRRFPPVPVMILVDNQAWRHDTAFLYPSVMRDTPCCGEFKEAA
jgi:hypothetical protein